MLNCGPTGSEALKNLVLGGVGSITVVDGSKVELGDLGNNFMGIFPARWFLLLASMELIISYVDCFLLCVKWMKRVLVNQRSSLFVRFFKSLMILLKLS